MDHLFPFELHRRRLLLFISWKIRGIILGKAVLLLIPRRDLLHRLDAGQLRLRMGQNQIILHELLQKIHGSGAVRQRMIDLEIDPVLMIADLEKQGFFVRNIEPAAGRLFLLFHNGADIPVLQVEPEKTFP